MKTHIKCPRCGGCGKITDPRFAGDEIRKARLKRGLTLREVAKEMAITAPYLSDMELGRRNVTLKQKTAFYSAITNLYKLD